MANDSLPQSCPPSVIEESLRLRAVTGKGADVFMNERPLWNPPWGRGIFGGAIIAQSLSAAQATVPSSFCVHSMHCHFLQAANNQTYVTYLVERLRNGKTLSTRTVQARQNGRSIFTATVSFMREGSAKKIIEHSIPMPADLSPPPDILESTTRLSKAQQTGEDRPCDCIRCPVSSKRGRPNTRKLQHWMRARGRISEHPLCAEADESEFLEVSAGQSVKNHQVHTMALAYMTDTYFIGTVARVHNASRFTNPRVIATALSTFHGSVAETDERRRFFENVAQEEMDENENMGESGKHIQMMVSVDHTIFFHNPRMFRADEWMLAEMDAPWAGHERGLVTQRIWNRDGVLIATCMQEGLVRLFQEDEKSHL